MFDIRVTGAESLTEISKQLRAAGEQGKGLRRELLKAIQRGTKEAKSEVPESWGREMPQRGGLADRPLKVTTKTRASGNNVGVRIVSASRDGYDLRSIDQGRLRHPVFGNFGTWAEQRVPEGVVTRPLEESAPKVREEILRAIDDIARRIEG